jgi:hypothetical protein
MPGNNDIVITACMGQTFSTNPGQGQGNQNDTFSWDCPIVSGAVTGGISAQGRSNITGYLINLTDSIQYVTYSITPGNGNSQADPFLYTVILKPCAQIIPLTITASSGSLFSFTPINFTHGIVPQGTTYNWGVPTGLVLGGSSASNQQSISGTLVNISGLIQSATYTVTPVTSDCNGSTFTLRVNVTP